ncbi:uncharacterized protein LOC131893647 [Tigriopus californicus]|uniref:uncharacterized protein LOC131893647 n=1 Tax=Tigriopus californicus TaxID=6832 RepID=UPI0027D9FB89|nr:uncharacterized protein LOC131893647 [Tigriopus californicus]
MKNEKNAFVTFESRSVEPFELFHFVLLKFNSNDSVKCNWLRIHTTNMCSFIWIVGLFLVGSTYGVEVTKLELRQNRTPVEYLDITGPDPILHLMYFEYILDEDEVVWKVEFEKDEEPLYVHEQTVPTGAIGAVLGNFSIREIDMPAIGPDHGFLRLVRPNAKMEGLYTVTVRTKANLTFPEFGNETLNRYRTHVRAFSNCTQMLFDGPFLNMDTCNVGIHFYCQHPIYPLQSVTQHKIQWTSHDDPSFSQEDNLNILEFETMPDGRMEFDLNAEYHVSEDSPASVDMHFMFSQFDNVPIIHHEETFNTNISGCRFKDQASGVPNLSTTPATLLTNSFCFYLMVVGRLG